MESLRTHTASCEACRGEIAAVAETWQMLGALTAPRADSAAMRARFDAVLDGYQEALAAGRGGGPARAAGGQWWNWQLALQLGAAAAVLVAGVALGRMTTAATPPDQTQVAALRQELADMRQMVTMSLLQQQSAAERLEGVAWTGRIERPGEEIVAALLDTLMHDANVNVRLASIEALRRFADQEMVRRSAIDALPRQSSPLVQIALIDFVLESSGAQAAPALRRLSQDAAVADAVRMHAARGLEQLGGQS